MEITEELLTLVESSTDLCALVDAYVMARDAKEQIKKEMTEKQKPITDLMDKLETKFLGLLDDAKADSVATGAGTVYRITKSQAKIADWKIFIDYAKKNDAFDLLIKNVAKDAVKARIEATGEIVPGVDLYSFNTVGIRRS